MNVPQKHTEETDNLQYSQTELKAMAVGVLAEPWTQLYTPKSNYRKLSHSRFGH